VTWSLATLLLALNVIAAICVLYITFRAFQQSVWWGLLFLLTPLVFFFGSKLVGPLIAGAVIFAAQIYFVRKYWVLVGRFFVYMVICWVGITAVGVYQAGWIPGASRASSDVAQAGEPGAAQPVGESILPVAGGHIWYKRSGAGSGTPVILVHGGPGYSSYYLKSLEALGDDREVVRYDQLGSGRSTKTADTTQFTIATFVRELDSLRAALGYEKVHILGHSWGTILGFEYYRAHPERVASLTLASATLSIPEWARHTRRLLKTLSDTSQRIIAAREAERDYDAPDYQEAVREFYGKYVFLRPVEADLDSTMKTVNQALYLYMWGPSEFTVTGTLKNFDATRRLRTIKVPTLYTVGEFDEANPATIRRFAARTPGARVEIIPDAAHITTWDNPDAMLRVVREFLRVADSTSPGK
jgi:proline iminopeptidase